ncbi:MAG: hypothetical protein AAGC76_05175 [Luteibacter sp.]|uniref:hypothetical protein n=1 Tax=Luteibacter sp. TaxID=1886636 RepID=UPI00280753DD|nr:hypothetical protein [Luteibacter sp.]MDQ7995229.1 hypothetical protein [Luteibacter sp.]
MIPPRAPLTPLVGVSKAMLAMVTAWQQGDRLAAAGCAEELARHAQADGHSELAHRAHTIAQALGAPLACVGEEARLTSVVVLAAEAMGLLSTRAAPWTIHGH